MHSCWLINLRNKFTFAFAILKPALKQVLGPFMWSILPTWETQTIFHRLHHKACFSGRGGESTIGWSLLIQLGLFWINLKLLPGYNLGLRREWLTVKNLPCVYTPAWSANFFLLSLRVKSTSHSLTACVSFQFWPLSLMYPQKPLMSISIDLYVKLKRNIYVGNFVIFPQLCLLRTILMYYFFLKGKHEDIVILCLLAVLSVVMLWFSYRNATVILSCKGFPLARSTTKRIKLFEVVFRYNTLHPAWRGSHRGVFTNYLFVLSPFLLL